MPSQDDLMTVSEIARYLRVSNATAYRLVKTGVIRGIRIGSAWRIRRDAMMQWLAETERLGDQSSILGRRRKGLGAVSSLKPKVTSHK